MDSIPGQIPVPRASSNHRISRANIFRLSNWFIHEPLTRRFSHLAPLPFGQPSPLAQFHSLLFAKPLNFALPRVINKRSWFFLPMAARTAASVNELNAIPRRTCLCLGRYLPFSRAATRRVRDGRAARMSKPRFPFRGRGSDETRSRIISARRSCQKLYFIWQYARRDGT